LIHEYFYFINFQFYVMKGNSERDFIMLYALMAGLFFLFLLVLFLISGKVFEEAKTEDVKEGTKIVLRIISILMCLYIFILQMPLVTLTFQGFLCDEEASEILVLTSIRCDSLTHQLLVLSSTIILIVYGAFLIIEQVLYSSNSFEEVVPWGSFERVLATVRVMIKTVISIGFVFDKKGQYRGEVNLILFFLQTFIVVRRYQDCIIFNTSVFYATIFYEACAMWLYLTVSIHILSDTPLTISTFTLLIITGLIFAGIIVFI
jgi:hypothetical protein